jgi:hypothetical protein
MRVSFVSEERSSLQFIFRNKIIIILRSAVMNMAHAVAWVVEMLRSVVITGFSYLPNLIYIYIYIFIKLQSSFNPVAVSTTIGHNRQVTHITKIQSTLKQNNNKGHYYS